jgi:hypothetical protein
MPLRKVHKLRYLPKTGKEFVLCTGKLDRFEIVRYGWENVDCPECLALRYKKVKPKQ